MKKNIFLKPFYRSLLAFIIILFLEKIGYSRYAPVNPVPWTTFFNEGFYRAFYISLAIFLWLCFWEFKKKKNER